MRKNRPQSRALKIALIGRFLIPVIACASWNGHGGDAQHTGISDTPALPLTSIKWSTPMDENAVSEPILIHYGSPVITQANTVVAPVRLTTGGFRIDALAGSTGAKIWDATTDFVTAPSNGSWLPSLSPALTPTGTLYYPGRGGSIFRVDNPNAANPTPVRLSFLSDYTALKPVYDSTVFVSTPITSDAAGNIYFGYEVSGSAPGGLTSGIARIAPDGTATRISANLASGITNATGYRVGTNSAPALSNDGTKVYLGLNGSSDYLVALDSATLTPISRRAIPAGSFISDAGTSSPTVGPDGDIYFGVLPGYHFRGTLLHFSADLSQSFTPGSFGWDETVSIVPASMVPSYTGSSSYLLFSKYNDYLQRGGTGINQLAILDPDDTQIDPVTGATVMKEVLTINGVTPDGQLPAVKEWCINTAAVDPATKSIIVNSEDGSLYRWDLSTNSFSEVIELQALGAFEAYTPTAIGPDGTAYAINKAVLFAVTPEPGSAALFLAGAAALSCARRRRKVV